MVRAGIIQSSYVPWRGYFDFIDDVDLFIFHDDIQYTKGDWRNRNRIKTANGLKWMTVPVRYNETSQLICDTEIDYSTDWRASHTNQFRGNYGMAPFCKDVIEFLKDAFDHRDATISRLNVRLVELICAYLGIKTPLVMSRDYGVSGAKTERLINLLEKAGATAYLSGPTAKGYLNEDLFREHGIGLEYKTYDYEPYPQLWGGFEGEVTVLDLIANTGPGAREFLKSKAPNIVAVEQNRDG